MRLHWRRWALWLGFALAVAALALALLGSRTSIVLLPLGMANVLLGASGEPVPWRLAGGDWERWLNRYCIVVGAVILGAWVLFFR